MKILEFDITEELLNDLIKGNQIVFETDDTQVILYSPHEKHERDEAAESEAKYFNGITTNAERFANEDSAREQEWDKFLEE